MPERDSFDGALKDVFQKDRPTLLRRFARAWVKRFLNVEVRKILQRRSDLIGFLSDGTILHIEFQSFNDPEMPYRMALYWTLIKLAHRGRSLRQIVLYVGKPPLSMADRLQEDEMALRYELADIRDIDAETLLGSGNVGDLALAILAGGGPRRLPEILRRASALPAPRRERVLAQILIFAGLRGVAKTVQSKLERMGVIIDETKNPVLMEWRRKAVAEGKAEGRAEGWAIGKVEGRVEGSVKAKTEVLQLQLKLRFGPLPKWAQERLESAPLTQLNRWTRRILTGKTLEDVIGSR